MKSNYFCYCVLFCNFCVFLCNYMSNIADFDSFAVPKRYILPVFLKHRDKRTFSLSLPKRRDSRIIPRAAESKEKIRIELRIRLLSVALGKNDVRAGKRGGISDRLLQKFMVRVFAEHHKKRRNVRYKAFVHAIRYVTVQFVRAADFPQFRLPLIIVCRTRIKRNSPLTLMRFKAI